MLHVPDALRPVVDAWIQGFTRFEEEPRSVVVVSEFGSWPEGLPKTVARSIPDVGSVTPEDDVVLLHGETMGLCVQELRDRLDNSSPPVLVVATDISPEDVATAVRADVTGYVIDGGHDGCPAEFLRMAITATASRLRIFDPQVVPLLVHNSPHPAPPERSRPFLPQVLTTREREVMERLAAGLTIADIACSLFLSEKTVRNYLSRIFVKLRVHRQSEAILLWLGHDPLPDDRTGSTGTWHDR